MADEHKPLHERDKEAAQLLGRIGRMARLLNESMRELGLEEEVRRASESIPDVCDRLNYIANMTESAANRSLSAIEVARPMQEKMGEEARILESRWQAWFDGPFDTPQVMNLVKETRAFLQQVPPASEEINAKLLEVIMAQEFQDITGQLVKKMIETMTSLEKELIEALLDYLPPEKSEQFVRARQQAKEKEQNDGSELLNGPAIKADGKEVVANQQQVDDLLDSLGF